ncbi:Thermophilic serine proteinase, partial [termite gut metagenome]
SFDMDEYPFFPNRNISDTKTLTTMITVAASDIAGNPLPDTNFGIKSLDLYAPGKDIYSSYVGNTCRSVSGSDIAAAMVTGVAALIKSYFPRLTAQQIKKVIVEHVTDRSGTVVEKQMASIKDYSEKQIKDLFPFEDLCASSGILNAAKAVEAASKLSK